MDRHLCIRNEWIERCRCISFRRGFWCSVSETNELKGWEHTWKDAGICKSIRNEWIERGRVHVICGLNQWYQKRMNWKISLSNSWRSWTSSVSETNELKGIEKARRWNWRLLAGHQKWMTRRLLWVLCKRAIVVIHVIMGIVNVVLFAELCIFCFSRNVLKACSWKSLSLERSI